MPPGGSLGHSSWRLWQECVLRTIQNIVIYIFKESLAPLATYSNRLSKNGCCAFLTPFCVQIVLTLASLLKYWILEVLKERWCCFWSFITMEWKECVNCGHFHLINYNLKPFLLATSENKQKKKKIPLIWYLNWNYKPSPNIIAVNIAFTCQKYQTCLAAFSLYTTQLTQHLEEHNMA